MYSKWWQEVKRFTGQSTRRSLDAIANDLFDGNLPEWLTILTLHAERVSRSEATRHRFDS